MLNQIDLSRIDLNLLVLFEAVFAERHVGRAADRLNLSASAVSHGLGRLRRLLNDPVFLRTPKGVVPSERAVALAPSIAAALEGVRIIVSRAEPFDPATSTRRFVVGAPDGVSAVFLQTLLADLQTRAPSIDIGIRQLLPVAGETAPERAWGSAFTELEARTLDVAIVPAEDAPLRFEKWRIYGEDFVLTMRRDHPFLTQGTIEAYCESLHLVVSHSGDPRGFVDDVLAREGLQRRVALTVPNFMFACAFLADTDLICAVPRRFASRYATRLGLVVVDAPLSLGNFQLNAFLPKAALIDDGLVWMLDRLAAAGQVAMDSD